MTSPQGKEITVMSGGSAEPALDFVAAEFQRETGYSVRISYNTGALGRKRMEDGEIFDVIVASSDAMKRHLVGKVEEGGLSIGRVGGLGVLVRPGAPLPDTSSVEALKHAVLEAESILYTSETSGLYIEEMLRRIGVYAQSEAKTAHCRNAPELMQRILAGSGAEFGFLSINAIRTYQHKGVVLAGLLPQELQYSYELVAAPSTRSTRKEVAWKFVRFCVGPGKPLLMANGLG